MSVRIVSRPFEALGPRGLLCVIPVARLFVTTAIDGCFLAGAVAIDGGSPRTCVLLRAAAGGGGGGVLLQRC